MSRPPLQTVRAWHEALNGGDAEGLIGLSDREVEVGGPRGVGRGSDLLLAWFERANVILRRYFHDERTVVVEERAEWRSEDTGEATESAVVASVFTGENGRITGGVRHDNLADALRAAGLDAASNTEVV